MDAQGNGSYRYNLRMGSDLGTDSTEFWDDNGFDRGVL